MTQKLTGKAIDMFAYSTNDVPDYFRNRLWTASPENKKVIQNGSFIAGRYNAILKLIKETKATVKVLDGLIKIEYQNGSVNIGRDTFTDTFLIPLLKDYQN